jgi:receptor protein-tyrosine kinase
MSIIEQAARRLEELRRSGIEIPDGSRQATPAVPLTLASAAPKPPARPATETPSRGAAGPSSRQVEIDLGRLAAMGYLTPNAPRSQIANEFRVIKRPLLNNLQGRSATPVERPSLIMVTSSLPGEGKTFVSVNLAISLAMELDKTVLLVDADVSRPSILSRLGLPPAPGLLDLLTDRSLVMSDVLLRTNIEKLALLPAGQPHGRATELLASDTMNRLLDEMASRYPDRVLVFDAPPLLPSTESRVLATHMGQVVLVVEAEQTQEKTVAQTLATIESCPVVLPLLNKISRSEVGSYYGYYGPTEG